VPVPALARWLLSLGIAATLAANVAHGLGHGPVGASVAAWPAVALVGSYELLMMVIRSLRTVVDRFIYQGFALLRLLLRISKDREVAVSVHSYAGLW
jgi:hypothetical protein